jgi:hypothetical protein
MRHGDGEGRDPPPTVGFDRNAVFEHARDALDDRKAEAETARDAWRPAPGAGTP